MNTLPFVIPVSASDTAIDGDVAFVQDITNGQVAESMTDTELAFAVLDIAADQRAFSMTHAVLDETARRLAPEIAGDQAPACPANRLTSAASGFFGDLPPAGIFVFGILFGGLISIASVAVFVFSVTQRIPTP